MNTTHYCNVKCIWLQYQLSSKNESHAFILHYFIIYIRATSAYVYLICFSSLPSYLRDLSNVVLLISSLNDTFLLILFGFSTEWKDLFLFLIGAKSVNGESSSNDVVFILFCSVFRYSPFSHQTTINLHDIDPSWNNEKSNANRIFHIIYPSIAIQDM